jgi:hypothetical protein
MDIVALIKKLPKTNMSINLVNGLDMIHGESIYIDTELSNNLNVNDYCCIKIIITDDNDVENFNEYIYIIDETQRNLNQNQKDYIIAFKKAVGSVLLNNMFSIQKKFIDALSIDTNIKSVDISYLKLKDAYRDKELLIASSGGKKGGVKYTVKQLQAIASKNNIKITKKVDGKTVRLNKKGLMTKLKRYKLI